MSDQPYTTGVLAALMQRVWDTRDGCADHYPRYCPQDCPNAGRHDAPLGMLGMCECHQCRTT